MLGRPGCVFTGQVGTIPALPTGKARWEANVLLAGVTTRGRIGLIGERVLFSDYSRDRLLRHTVRGSPLVVSTRQQIEIEELIRQARTGTGESLGVLLGVYANYLRLLASTQLDAKLRTRVSPSDLVQETFCEAHRDFGQFRGHSESELLGWLRKILVHNLARMVERHVLAAKRDVRREVSLHEIGVAMDQSALRLEAVLADGGASPSSHAQQREWAVALANKLAELPNDYQQVIKLRNLDCLAFHDVAAKMRRSTGAARMLWLRAVEQLRRSLGEGGSR